MSCLDSIGTTDYFPNMTRIAPLPLLLISILLSACGASELQVRAGHDLGCEPKEVDVEDLGAGLYAVKCDEITAEYMCVNNGPMDDPMCERRN